MPTLFLAAPYWLDAESYPWTCLRAVVPQALETTAPCETCPNWQARPGDAADLARPTMLDWFSAFPAPHETD